MFVLSLFLLLFFPHCCFVSFLAPKIFIHEIYIYILSKICIFLLTYILATTTNTFSPARHRRRSRVQCAPRSDSRRSPTRWLPKESRPLERLTLLLLRTSPRFVTTIEGVLFLLLLSFLPYNRRLSKIMGLVGT